MLKAYMSFEWQNTCKLLQDWKEGDTFGFEDCDELNTVEKLLRFSQRYEVKARKTALDLPRYESSLICMNLYTYIVYFSKANPKETFYSQDYLHLYAMDAIRLLQYGDRNVSDAETYKENKMLLLLRMVEVIFMSREIAKYLQCNLISNPERIAFKGGRFILADEDLKFAQRFGENFNGKGTRLRMAEDTSHFLFEVYENKDIFLKYLSQIQKGKVEEWCQKAIRGTCYEFLPILSPTDPEYADYSAFIKELDARIRFTVEVMKSRDLEDNIFFTVGNVCADSIPKGMICEPEFKRWRMGDEEHLALTYAPVVKISEEVFLTCFALCGDSVNAWIERQLNKDFEQYKWKQQYLGAMEIQFEQEVNSFLREMGYRSSNLKQNGEWLSEKLPVRLQGECDVFAIHEKEKNIYLLECKRLHDAISTGISYKTMESNRKKILQKFVPKLYNKKQQLETYIKNRYPDYHFSCGIITDVDFPMFIREDVNYKWKDEIVICDFNALQEAVRGHNALRSALFIRK